MAINDYLGEKAPQMNSQRGISRRGFLNGIGTLVGSLCLGNVYAAEPKTQKQEEKIPSYEDFKQVLVKKGKFNPRYEKELKTYFSEGKKLEKDDGKKRMIYLREKDPEKYLLPFDDPTQKKIREVVLGKNVKEVFKQKGWIWNINVDNLDLSDKIYFYVLDSLIYAFGSDKSKHSLKLSK